MTLFKKKEPAAQREPENGTETKSQDSAKRPNLVNVDLKEVSAQEAKEYIAQANSAIVYKNEKELRLFSGAFVLARLKIADADVESLLGGFKATRETPVIKMFEKA
ncbi:MAG: hypothetical protein M1125_02060 [Candidatus Marsarchaeota archaeon]|nr:hypothetical protein [Candidatus Marsarchaeota archaeon]